MDIVYTVLLGIIEGVTEFLPISSTGHLLIVSTLMGFPQSLAGNPEAQRNFREVFDIFIQSGAVIAVILYYFKSLLDQARKLPSDRPTQMFWLNVLVAFLPAAVVGLLVEKYIDALMNQPGSNLLLLAIGSALIVGGVIFLLVERQDLQGQTQAVEQVTLKQAFLIGLAQVTSLIPGISRSGATIVGGLLTGLDRVTATTFSFYLFIPTLGAATAYKLFSALRNPELRPYITDQFGLFIVGTVVAFAASYAAIAWLLGYIAKNNFRPFGIYRIVGGALIIGLALSGLLAR
jgi:undecaprenyl-diphosphatase